LTCLDRQRRSPAPKHAAAASGSAAHRDGFSAVHLAGQQRGLGQRLNILLANALQAGARSLLLSAHKIDDEAVIRVVDNGCGMLPTSWPGVRTLFTTRSRGTGLVWRGAIRRPLPPGKLRWPRCQERVPASRFSTYS
jgi:signal transduction histidine kinase